MKKTLALVGTVLSMVAGSAVAQVELSDFYVGGGISNNELSYYDDATGFQIFGGFNLDRLLNLGVENLSLAAEVGYMDSGDFKYKDCWGWGWMTQCGSGKTSASGLWTTGVVSYAVLPQLNLIGRLGVDLGDDDGLMVGAGVGYSFTKAFELRGEYVVRDNIDSLQVNVAYRF